MSLLTLQGGRLAFGHVALLDDAALSIDAGERIALIGRNGTGKSSLLKALAGQIALDDGRIVQRNGCTLAYVAQEPVFDAAQSVHQAVAAALPAHAELIERHQRIASALAGEALSISDQESLTGALAAVQTELGMDGHASY